MRCLQKMAGALPIVSPMLTALASVSVSKPPAFSLGDDRGAPRGRSTSATDPKAPSSRASELNDPANYPFVVLDEPFSAAVRASAVLGGDAR